MGGPSGLSSAHLEAGLVWGGLDEVVGPMAHRGHVPGGGSGSQAAEIVVEDDVHVPVQAVLDAPVRAHGGGELLGTERRGGDVEAPRRGRSRWPGQILAFKFRIGLVAFGIFTSPHTPDPDAEVESLVVRIL